MSTSPVTAGSPIVSGESFNLDLKVGDTLLGAAEENGPSSQTLTYPNPQLDPLQASGSAGVSNPDNGWGADFVRPGDVVILPASPQSSDGADTAAIPLNAGSGHELTSPEATPAGSLLSNAQTVVESASAVTQRFEQPVENAGQPGSHIPQGHFHT